MAEACNICRNPLNSRSGFALSRGNIPAFRVCDRCGNSLEALMQKLETLASVQKNLGLDRIIAA